MTEAHFPCGPTTIAGPVGALETVIDCPGRPWSKTAIVCHPHPLYGGSLRNKVTHTLARTFVGLGLAAIRFNFRGVGQSEGSYGHGHGEAQDLLAVARWLRARRPHDALWLAGFSFGGLIALHMADELEASQLVTVAPAVNRPEARQLKAPRCPWLLVMGEADEVVTPQAVRAWVAGLERPPEERWVPEVGHFFHQRLTDLRTVLEQALGPVGPS